MLDFRKAVSRHVVENPAIRVTPRKRRFRLPFLSRKSIIVIGVIGCAVVVYFFAGQYVPGGDRLPGVAGGSADGKNVTTTKINQKPDYITVLPGTKKIEELGGWSRVSPPDRNPVFAYSDKVENISVNISQQPLPDSFMQDSAKSIEELAKSYSAEEKVTIGDITAYIGTSAKGPQSVIFTKKNLLILIKSTDKLTTNQWASYISSLN